MNITCVIVTHNSANTIRQLVDSLLMQTLKPTKIIIVDNASSDDTVYILQKHSAYSNTLQVESLPFNIGGAGGFRRGLELAINTASDYIVTFDDDVRITDSEYIKKLVSFVKNEKLDVASSLVVDIDNHKQSSFYYKLPSGSTNNVELILQSKSLINDVKFFNGAIFAIQALNELKGPRPEFFIRGDEQEFRLRVLSYNYKVGIAVDAIIYHPSATQESVLFNGCKLTIIDHVGKQYFSTRNRFYLYSRFYGHQHSPLKMFRMLTKSLYVYCNYYISHKDYIGLYIWLRAFIDGVSGRLNSDYSHEIRQKYFN